MSTDTDGFEFFDDKATDDNPVFAKGTPVDPVWKARMEKLPVGYSFRAKRDDDETKRQFVKRINAAARATFRTLEWKSEEPNVDIEKAHRFIVRVKSLDLKKQAEAKNGQNGTVQAQQTTTATESTTDTTQEETASSGPRRPR